MYGIGSQRVATWWSRWVGVLIATLLFAAACSSEFVAQAPCVLLAVQGDEDALSALLALRWAATDELEVILGAALCLSAANSDVMFLGAFRREF